MRDYLYRKTLNKKVKNKKTGELKDRPGVSKEITERVYNRLVERGYIDDDKFARFWVENRNITKGTSRRKLQAELQAKGVNAATIDAHLSQSERSDANELQKIIMKKRKRYPDERKFMQYLARQGFGYDDIRNALSEE